MTTLCPAYGRDYKSGKEAKAAFLSGADFVITDYFHPSDGRYANVSDLTKGETYMLRFKRLTGVCTVKVPM